MKKVFAALCFLALFLTINAPGFAYRGHDYRSGGSHMRSRGPHISVNLGYNYVRPMNRHYMSSYHNNGYGYGYYAGAYYPSASNCMICKYGSCQPIYCPPDGGNSIRYFY